MSSAALWLVLAAAVGDGASGAPGAGDAPGLAIGAPPRNDGRSWPTLHGDLRRSGFYPSFPRGPLRLAWRKELHRELTGTRVEVIVGKGLAFLGTMAGSLYAWDAATGEERWVFHAGGPILHSPMLLELERHEESRLFVASMDRRVYAIEASSGKERWRFEADEGFWASPVVWAEKVLVGARDGVLYALDAETGAESWRFETGGPILTTASITDDGGGVVFASEDLHAYRVRVTDGHLQWRSAAMRGLSVRDYFPVIVGGVALFTTNPVDGFHDVLDRHQQLLLRVAGFEDQTQTVGAKRRYIPYSEAGLRREQKAFLEHLRAHPEDRTFYAFRLRDGAEPWVAPVAYTGGLHNPPTPPCYDPRTGEVFVFVRSAYGVWDGGGEVRPYSGVGKLEPGTGRVDLVEHAHRSSDPARGAGRRDMPWGTFWTIGDEAQSLSLSSEELFSNHQGSLGALSRTSGLTRRVFGKRDTYGGFFGPGTFGWGAEGRARARASGQPFGLVNEWHGPARSIAAVAGGRVYYHVGSQVLCFERRR